MTTKSLKKFTELLNRSEGLSLIAIVVLMVIMSVMGVVFTSIMGTWKISAPTTINSTKAFYLAETAAMFALQEARYKFYGGSFDSGTSDAPRVVLNSDTERATFWIEKPGLTDDGGSDDDSDDDIDDDLDDGVSDLYTIIATGKVIRDGSTVAKRQIKIKAYITPNTASPVEPGIHAEGSIRGSGSGAFKIWMDGLDVSSVSPSVAFSNGTYDNSESGQYSGSRTDVIYQASAFDSPDLEEEFFKAVATDQGHYNPTIPNNSTYPVGSSSYYYDAPTNTIPNITFISGSLDCRNVTLYGIYYVKGAVAMQGNMQVKGIMIGESDIKLSASAAAGDPHLNGGIIQLGASPLKIWGAGTPSTVKINNDYFDALNNTIPIITVVSHQEAISAK